MKPFFKSVGTKVDEALDNLTSYQLMLYFLILTSSWAATMAALGELSFDWYSVAGSVLWLAVVCWSVGYLFARLLSVPRNRESDFISALILSLILTPASSAADLAILAGAGFAAVASKYLLAPGRRHIFNPAAFGAFFAATVLDYLPSWWVGTSAMLPIILLGGLLVLRKMNRFIMAGLFLTIYVAVLSVELLSSNSAAHLDNNLRLAFTATPLLFFSFVMLIEPLTSPSKLQKYLPYVLIVGLLYSVKDFGMRPEEALLIGNLFAYLTTRDRRFRLKLVKKQKEAHSIYSFIFSTNDRIDFQPGQYMEWTLPGVKIDSRGNRRYFTISGSPSEKYLRLTTKFPDKPSCFKQKLLELKPGDDIIASHVSGGFTLPAGHDQKVVLIAGGIGVTPYRSMAKYLVDSQTTYDAILLYAAGDPAEFAFKDLFDKAQARGIKTKYVITEPERAPSGWDGYRGKIDAELIKKAVPDYKERLFYLSGPHGLVKYLEVELAKLKVPSGHIKTDYFPGYG